MTEQEHVYRSRLIRRLKGCLQHADPLYCHAHYYGGPMDGREEEFFDWHPQYRAG